MPKKYKFKITEYTMDANSKFGVTRTFVEAVDIDEGIRNFLNEKGESCESKFVLCAILQNGKRNVPFKNFTYGERKKTHVSEYVTNIQNAMIEPSK